MKDGTTQLASKAHPEIKRPIQHWQVKVGSIVYYENTSIQLCWSYITKHKLNCIPKPVY